MVQLDVLPVKATRRRGRPAGTDSAQTRVRILGAAREVIAVRGYHATTIQAIAEIAELSRPTLHYHFQTREDIYHCLLNEIATTIDLCIARAGAESTLPEQVSVLITEFRNTGIHEPESVALLVSSYLEADRLPAPRRDAKAAVRKFLDQAVREAVVRAELPATTVVPAVADLLYSMVWGLGFYAGLVADRDRVEAVTKQLQLVLHKGLLVGPVATEVNAPADRRAAVVAASS
ncbi:TetR/AcrR family transcriptional regulator [Mycolicibacterium sp. NCC-Tsukiji]|uniref:TetR/AcrR family transcriptional regulator n=1 Tax=Mycolicibacterium sp. NCC-Tsukiji TaxID=2185272 RepID=UPI000EDE5D81|nr:TetR/AcrR family transcriptional regulator [Mycolicibacterium sp. NCC-Tsukiji]GCA96606.1 TetR family transcriptional regulator [Mycolicibacterium sp. NCC-Tsukiji]